MGSSASKGSQAVGAAARQYPKRSVQPVTETIRAPSPPTPRGKAPGPTVRPRPLASGSRSEAIDHDASDPDFARSLRSLGPVQPNPTMSATSTFTNPNPQQSVGAVTPDPRGNPALAILHARQTFQEQSEQELMEIGKSGHKGRQFLDIYTIRQMLLLRDERNKRPAEIERALDLRAGVFDRLGPPGVVELVQEMGRARREVDIV